MKLPVESLKAERRTKRSATGIMSDGARWMLRGQRSEAVDGQAVPSSHARHAVVFSLRVNVKSAEPVFDARVANC